MYHIFFIAKNNAKKQKGDIITLIVLSFLASFLLYTGASVLTDLGNEMDVSAEEHNTAHVYYWVPEFAADELEENFLENSDVKEHDKSRADSATAKYRNPKISDEWSSFQFLFGSYEEERTINTLAFDTSALKENDILIPYYIKPQYEIGDTIEFKLGDDVYSYKVAGYVSDPMFASSINLSVYNMYISDGELDRITGDHPEAFISGRSLKYRGGEDADVYAIHEDLWERFQNWISADESRNSVNPLEVNWWDMKGGGSFMPQIVMAIFMVFAMLVMLIALIIISFSIRNFIERNMKNTGILEAAGYKTAELSLAIVLENAAAALTGALTGVALTAITQNAVGNIVALILGLPWNQSYNYAVAGTVVAAIVLMVIIACLVSSRQYTKVSVLDCLRGGINNHNFKRNHLPFESSGLPVPVTLSLKELFGDKRRNFVITIIVAIIAISNNVGFAMVGTFGGKTEAIMDLSGLEVPTAQVTESRDIFDDIKALDSVDHVLISYTVEPTLRAGDVTSTVSIDVYDIPSLIEHNMMIEGRLPETSKEICLTRKVADEFGVGLGDIIYIDYGSKHIDYVVCGLDQKINHMGRKCILSDDGALRFLGDQSTVAYLIYAKEGVEFSKLSSDISKFTNASVDDSAQVVSETISTVSNSMYIICVAVLAVTAMIVIFVEILLVRSKIIRERRNYGVNKALGFTSGQLMVQTMISNVPAILIGVLIGSAVSAPVASFVMSVSLSFFGMGKIDISVPAYGLAATLAGILAVAMITSLVCSLSIRRIEPAGLLAEE